LDQEIGEGRAERIPPKKSHPSDPPIRPSDSERIAFDAHGKIACGSYLGLPSERFLIRFTLLRKPDCEEGEVADSSGETEGHGPFEA